MDLALLIALAAVTALILLGIGLFFNLQRSSKLRVAENRGAHVAQRVRDAPRRAQIARNRGVRMRANVQQNEDDQDSPHEVDTIDDKIGTKKRAKLEAKAEKKAQREAEEQLRQDKKKREQLAEEERRKAEEKRLVEEKHLEEEERKAREEKERKEYEDYLEMKKAFTVEEEGFEESDGSDGQNLLQEFVNYVKSKKVVVIEDLAAHFKLKTQSAIDRIQDLQKDDILTGVIDDRGKFIYVSPEEMEAVATFIRQRGRISIVELAENSNRLISLTPTTLASEL